jgi:hypothetical protein
VLGGLVTFAGLSILPGGTLLIGIFSLGAGAFVTLPFIWPEIKQLTQL